MVVSSFEFEIDERENFFAYSIRGTLIRHVQGGVAEIWRQTLSRTSLSMHSHSFFQVNQALSDKVVVR